MKERYSRQSLIKGWNQKKLESGYIAIVGGNYTSALTSFIASGLSAMGVGKILLTGERTGDAGIFGFDGKLEEYIAALNSDVTAYFNEVKLSNQDITEEVLSETINEKPNIIIDVSNESDSQSTCLDYGKKNKIPVFVGISNIAGFIFLRSVEDNKQKNIEELIKLTLEFNKDEEQNEGKLNSSILASIIIDETRKKLMPLNRDVESRDFFYKNSDFPRYIDKNVLMVGAGAIGTFAGIGIALNGIKNLYIADFDSIEIGNLASQILYYNFDKLKTNKKSAVLCSRLEKISERYCFQRSNFISLEEKINPEFINNFDSKIDVLLGCVDNMYTRAVLNMFSTHKEIPYIDGGSGKFGCDIFTYLPKKTACLDCQLDGTIEDSILQEKENAEKEKESEECLFEPSLIIPNEIAGSSITNRLKKIEKEPVSISFLSGDSIKTIKPKEKCKEGCNPYSLISKIKKWETIIL